MNEDRDPKSSSGTLPGASSSNRPSHAVLAVLTALSAACGTADDNASEAVANRGSAVLGDVTYAPPGSVPLQQTYVDASGNTVTIPRSLGTNNPECPPDAKNLIERLTRVSRIIATTDAYASCVRQITGVGLTTPICGKDGAGTLWGPYQYQPGDPFQGEPPDAIATRAVEAVTNPNNFSVTCDLELPVVAAGGAAYAQAVLEDGSPTVEDYMIPGYSLAGAGPLLPNAGRKTASQADYFLGSGSGFWHEAMHQRGWQHKEAIPATPTTPAVPGTYCSSVPYMIAQCMEMLAAASQACTDTCPGELRPVARWNSPGCVCSADPGLIHSIYKRVRGRSANPGELKRALQSMTQGTTLAQIEQELRHPTILRSAATMTIDGFAAEAPWQSAVVNAIDTPVVNNTSGTLFLRKPATWQATYDNLGLYFFVDVDDPTRFQDNSPGDQHQDDSVEIYIDADGSGGTSYGQHDFQLAFRPGDTNVYYGDNSATSPVAPTVAWQNRPDGSGYRLEVLLPWIMINTAPGSTLGLEVHVNDDDNGGDRDAQYAWATNSADAWTNPSLFTKVALAESIGTIAPNDSIVVDGQALEPSWNRPGVSITRLASPTPGSNTTGQWRAFWNNFFLFVFVNVNDTASTTFDSADVWDDDSIELYIDPDNGHSGAYDGNDYHYTFRRNNPGVIHVGSGSASNTIPVSWSMRNVAGGYTLEAAIPWGALGMVPSDKTEIGFDVHINDDDNGGAREGKRTWYANRDVSWQDTTTFGAIRLTGAPGPSQQFNYVATPPVIDGVTNDPAWLEWVGAPAPISHLVSNAGALTVDSTATWRGLWDDDNIYLHVEVAETDAPVANSGSSWWQDDSVEIFFDPGYSHAQSYAGNSAFQFIFRPGSNNFVGSTSTVGITGVQVASTSDGSGYTMEIKIPWRGMKSLVGVGSALGFDINVNDDDADGTADRDNKQGWAISPFSGDVSYVNPRTFGYISLAQ